MKPCDGGCGRPVSKTKRYCLMCLAEGAARNLMYRQGIDASPEDVARLILKEAGK